MVTAKTLLDVRKNYSLRTFLWALGLAICVFAPWMIFNDGYFFFYGDFNVQQIPFNQMIHDSVRDGNIGWSYTTDLGSNIIGSYSFYMFGSPFFWITELFPGEAVPYLMAPLLMLKIAFAALGAYVFLRRYVKNQNYAVFGALMYAFSGFSIYNVFFNHFHEAMILFPFLLAAVDSFIYDKKRGVLAFTVFLSCLVNYYFFAAQAIFIIIYWIVRMLTGSYKLKFTEFLRFATEVIIGFGAAAVLLVPSVLAVAQNTRVHRFQNGWNALVYSSEQRYIHILEAFFFPPDMPAYANFTPDSNAKWGSVAGWLPMFSMVGVFAFFKLRTHKWLRMLIPILCIIAYVPLFNSVFQLFNSLYYARWFYMMTLIFVLATIIAIDNEKTDFKPALIVTFVITLLVGGLIGFMPTESSKNSETKYGLEKYPDRFWIWVALAFGSLLLLMLVLCFRRNKKLFVRFTGIGISLIIVGYSNVLIGTGVLKASYKKSYIIDNAINGRDTVSDLKDIKNVRSDFYEEMDNMGMFWQIPTIQAFQSIVPGSVMDFYPTVGVERSVASRPKTDVYAIRSFLSVKYLFDNTSDTKNFATSSTYNVMPGWEFLEEKNNYKIYQNKYYIPYGFTYDTYVTEEEYDNCTESNRSKLLLKSIVLTDEQIEKYGSFLKHDENLSEYKYTQNEYFKDCEERKKLTCSSVDFENNKITAEITTGDSEELVFFSIPYEEGLFGYSGWTAEVNGEAVDIEKVNVGFMAVKVPANTKSTIVFKYKTPGLLLGAIISLIFILLFVLYMLIWKAPKKRPCEGLYLIDDLAPKKKKSAVIKASADDPLPDEGKSPEDTVRNEQEPLEAAVSEETAPNEEMPMETAVPEETTPNEEKPCEAQEASSTEQEAQDTVNAPEENTEAESKAAPKENESGSPEKAKYSKKNGNKPKAKHLKK